MSAVTDRIVDLDRAQAQNVLCFIWGYIEGLIEYNVNDAAFKARAYLEQRIDAELRDGS